MKVSSVPLKKEKAKKESTEEDDDEGKEENNKLPEMKEGDILSCKEILTKQKFTKPSPRYTVSTLIDEMEQKGIGRPATYAPTINLLFSRKYVETEGKVIKPTELGEKLTEFLVKGYEGLFNVHFTADMEEKLDKIANEGLDYLGVMKKFNDYLEKLVGQPTEPIRTGIMCEKCGHEMVQRVSKYGEFLACSNYPNCKNIQSIVKVVGVCPKCKGEVIERRSKTGKIFYGCKSYPNCDFISWEIPIEEKCPKCGSYMTEKEVYGKLRHKCSNQDCGYTENKKKNEVVENA